MDTISVYWQYAYKYVDLDGFEPILPPLYGLEPPISEIPVESIMETGAKVSEIPKESFSSEQLQNFNRGNEVEAEQLSKNGLEKNFKPIETVDPKTRLKGKSIPDAFEDEGKSTVEIKNVSKQSLTKQLRLQEKFSNDNGGIPRLIINQSAKLTQPLLRSSFKIDYYNIIPPIVRDNTNVAPTPLPADL